MFHLKKLRNRFKLSVKEYNKIVAFLNNLCAGPGIHIQRPDIPSDAAPVLVKIDDAHVARIANKIAAPFAPEELNSGVTDDDSNVDNSDHTVQSIAVNKDGFSFMACTRANISADGEHIGLYFRTIHVTKDGRISMIGKEKDAVSVYTDQG